jgi:GT2 family glycosyltransferase
VVDQSAGDETGAIVRSLADSRVRYIRTSSRGLGRARNVAIEAARGEVILFTDDDCITTAHWIEDVLEAFESHPQVSAVFGKVLGYGQPGDGVVHHLVRKAHGTGTYATRRDGRRCEAVVGFERPRVFRSVCAPHQNVGSGNNMGLKKRRLAAIGGFCPLLGPGARLRNSDDTEFIYRMLRHGHRVLYSPKPLVYHNRWLDKTEHLCLEKTQTLGKAAVYTFYRLKGDRLAGALLCDKLRALLAAIRRSGSRGERASQVDVLRCYLLGVLGGVYLSLTWGIGD